MGVKYGKISTEVYDMNSRKLLDSLCVAERLKDATRHCYTKNGRHESVAEHSWMMTLMAFFMKDEFPDVDMNKVIKMCIIHLKQCLEIYSSKCLSIQWSIFPSKNLEKESKLNPRKVKEK